MKPKGLKFPFSWENRRVLIQDRIWYVPDYYDRYEEFSFPGWEYPDLFGNSHPVKVEYCSGNGAWLAEKAEQHPEWNWVGVEMRFERVRKIWSKIKNKKLNNLIVVCGEGCTVTKHYFPNESISEIYINFPDPWPKKRHEKHRLMQSAFVKEMHCSLRLEGTVTLVTDDPDYSAQMIEAMRQHPRFTSCYDTPYYVTSLPGYGSSFFEELWRSKGKTIYYHRFHKESL